MLKRAAKPENAQPAAKRKLTRAERKQIEAIIRQAKGDGKNHTVQDSIPFRNLYPDGLCRLDDRHFSKTIAYADVSYRLAGPDDQRDIFERLCDFYNGYDPSIGVQMTLSSRHEDKNGNLFGMDAQGDALDDMRVEASGILQIQYERGNNGFVKRKYVTLTIEAENLPAARARFSRIEADTLNRFKVMGAGARVLDGKERLALLHGLLHPEGGQFAFEWNWLPASGLSVKDFIAPSSFEFGETRRFRMGEMYGAVSFLQILAPEIQDRILTDFMDVEGNLLVTMHVRGINQNEAIKMVKRKITDLDAMKIQEQKKAARSGYDLDILPSDQHDIVSFHFSFHLNGSYQFSYKGVLQGVHSMSLGKTKYHAYDPGTMSGQHNGTHMRNIVLFFKNSRDFINRFLGNSFRIAIYNIGYRGAANACHICNILKPNHKTFLLYSYFLTILFPAYLYSDTFVSTKVIFAYIKFIIS